MKLTTTLCLSAASCAAGMAAIPIGAVLVLSGAKHPQTQGLQSPPPNQRTPGGFQRGGGFMDFNSEERKVVKDFDLNKNGWLETEERAKARAAVKANPSGRGPGGFGRQNQRPATPGKRISPSEVKPVVDKDLYDDGTLRTLFFEFEGTDWEAEMADFYNTDVEVPAALTVDGKRYPNVGVSFRGQSSYFSISAGFKRSLNVAVDMADSKLRIYGVRTLNLLNAMGDNSMMSTVLYSAIARSRYPAPRANYVRVVINGEYWGVYVNAEQFNSDFIKAHFKEESGARWKVNGSPGGDAGLNYLGEDLAPYKSRYTLKTKDKPEDWAALVKLCKTLSETPLESLEKELASQLDIDGALWFLALDVALVNSDGYWIRASDYSLYRDPKGKFHLIPHDMNEAFRGGRGGPGFGPPPGGPPPGGIPPGGQVNPPPGGPPPGGPPQGGPPRGFGGGGRGRGLGEGSPTLDPLVGMSDARKPLRSRLLMVPSLRKKYLRYVNEIATGPLAWSNLGASVAKYRKLIEADVKDDVKKPMPTEAFLAATSPDLGPGPSSLRAFSEARTKYLLNYREAEGAGGGSK